ncbi:uncharacterized protein [Miscanthus floridulus]|uniref:uncharacterized protein n=1 Tax=Miscanthus floridulus TaxID=154761 RepID=UPI00345A67B5
MPMGIFASDQYKRSVRYEELEQIGDRSPALGSRADQPSVPFDPKVMELNEDPAAEPDPLADWRMPYLNYLLCEALSMNKMEAWWLARRTKSFVVIEGELYRRSYTCILQRYISIEQGK